VGTDTYDDAGVYRLSDELALVQTVDFFTPIVDDPYDYGQIAAANALSDVYAMGGTPRTALALVCWPPSGLEPEILGAILAGGAEKALEAGCPVIGGHSVQDEELKYGLAVTGTAHPARILTNARARPGDVLVLTKPLGTGILTTALKRGAIDALELAPAVRAMKTLNGPAAREALRAGVRSATDVTGFGLAGHAVQLADASGVTLEIESAALPLLPSALRLAEAGHIPGGGEANRAFYGPRIEVRNAPLEALLRIFFDPQTSGGLLLAVPDGREDGLLGRLDEEGVSARVIGAVGIRRGPSVLLT
jgi:selenide,water dikinase